MCLAWWSCDSRAVWLERIPLRWIVQWRLSPVLRRWVLTGAVALGCLLWAMVVVGLSFAIVERSAPQWWLMLVFGMVVPLVTLVVVRGTRAITPVPYESQPSAPVVRASDGSTPADRRQLLDSPIRAAQSPSAGCQRSR